MMVRTFLYYECLTPNERRPTHLSEKQTISNTKTLPAHTATKQNLAIAVIARLFRYPKLSFLAIISCAKLCKLPKITVICVQICRYRQF